MKKVIKLLLIPAFLGIIVFLLPSISAAQETAKPITADEISKEAKNKQFPKNSVIKMTMTLINKKGQKRVRKLRIKRKNFAEGETKAISTFLSPPDVKGTTVLMWEHEDKANDVFLYLPALKKIRRIASDQKSQSFMGSDFSYADMEKGMMDDADHKILSENENFEGKACWTIESIPKPGNEKDSEYGKMMSWVAKETYIPYKIEFYNKKLELHKKMLVLRSGPVGDEILPLHLLMENVKKNHKTEIVFDEILLKQNLSEKDFSKQAMQRQR